MSKLDWNSLTVAVLGLTIFGGGLVAFCFLVYTGHYYASIIPALLVAFGKVNYKKG